MIKSGGPVVRTHHIDYVIALLVTVLLAIGLVMMYSISPILSNKLLGHTDNSWFYFLNQLKFVGIGLVVLVIATAVPYTVWRKWAPKILLVAILGVFTLLIPGLGASSHGATRWLQLGPISVQPAEILKMALILYLAAWFEKRQDELRSWWDGVIPFIVMAGAACFVIVVFQRDMGTMMVLALATLGMYYAAGMKLKHLGILLAGGAAAGGQPDTYCRR